MAIAQAPPESCDSCLRRCPIRRAAIQVGETNSFISFQEAAEYVRPVWPAEPGKQLMMMHIDVAVDDVGAAVAAAQELGATLAEYQPQEECAVLLDPAGHPFCLYLDKE